MDTKSAQASRQPLDLLPSARQRMPTQFLTSTPPRSLEPTLTHPRFPNMTKPHVLVDHDPVESTLVFTDSLLKDVILLSMLMTQPASRQTSTRITGDVTLHLLYFTPQRIASQTRITPLLLPKAVSWLCATQSKHDHPPSLSFPWLRAPLRYPSRFRYQPSSSSSKPRLYGVTPSTALLTWLPESSSQSLVLDNPTILTNARASLAQNRS
ncbi:hypothetical protein BDP55DRAFT_372158 [Colletotrichum godetiae]|uniref:Uncharacterized protein n=1 Tax=Colletotrichum godetiae TaxID=1209918 RepID=A0AAJ0ERY9_9PEZI|nr:uncharacterized protein BDP55DRAFT_372158 [Colletotrichum godetiae]KAK1658953.1 hypothetical protein BDP55DRAFT_372158 [Colletotrichum godetiae]